MYNDCVSSHLVAKHTEKAKKNELPVCHNLLDAFDGYIVAALFEHLFLGDLTQWLGLVHNARTQFNGYRQSGGIFVQIDVFECGVCRIGWNYWMVNRFKCKMTMAINRNGPGDVATSHSPGRNCFTNTKVLRVLFSMMIATLSCTFSKSQFFSLPFCT